MKKKANKHGMVIRPAILGAASALLLAACGGGSSSSAGSAANNASNPSLSDAQKNYETFELASNGGLHYMNGSLSFNTGSTGALSIGSSSTFFTTDS